MGVIDSIPSRLVGNTEVEFFTNPLSDKSGEIQYVRQVKYRLFADRKSQCLRTPAWRGFQRVGLGLCQFVLSLPKIILVSHLYLQKHRSVLAERRRYLFRSGNRRLERALLRRATPR